MKRSISSLLVGIMCVGVISGSATLASADTASDLQNQLKTVLDQINSLKSQLNTIDGVTADGSNACPKISRMLIRGAKGQDVLALQTFLAQDANIYPEGVISGFFGFATERAVQRFQERHGIAIAGTADTTGYGLVGTKTRQAIASACASVAGTGTTGTTGTTSATSSPAQVVDFAFEQTKGTAPFDARVKLQVLESACVSFEIDWGDRTTPTSYEATQSTSCGTGITDKTFTHTYMTSGTYMVTLKAVKGSRIALQKVMTRTIEITKGEPYLRVEAPTSGVSVRLGDLTKVKWSTGNFPTDSAIAFYAVGPTQTYSFAKRSMRTTEFDWIVGDGVCDGNSCSVQMPAGTYRIRAAMYTPADGCIDFCRADDKRASVVLVAESGDFAVTQLGTAGSNPIRVSDTRGVAPFAVNIHVEIPPTSVAANFEVDFGDKTPKYTVHIPIGETRSVVRDIPHVYTKTGSYSIQLRPVGSVQNVGSADISVDEPSFVVIPRDGAFAPATARATFNVDTSCSIGNANARRYTVDWGDSSETGVYEYTPTRCVNDIPGAQQNKSQTLTHVYTNPGSYTVKYRISDGVNSFDATSGVHLTQPELTVSPTFGFAPVRVTASFKADVGCSASGAAKGKYIVDWGDGTAVYKYEPALAACSTTRTSSLVDIAPAHTYKKVGNYTIKLTSGRYDIAQTMVKTKSIVIDTKKTSYLWHRVTGLFTGQESIVDQTAAVANGIYNVFSEE